MKAKRLVQKPTSKPVSKPVKGNSIPASLPKVPKGSGVPMGKPVQVRKS